MYQGRLYTFGCSMTSYSWPTWADILGKEFIYHENWGLGSAGNMYIFNSLIECLERNEITATDTIVILWSGITRIDYYQFGKWAAAHNKSILGNESIDLVSCPDGFELISYAYFAAIDKLLSAKKLNYHMFKFLDYDVDTKAGKIYTNALNKIKKLNFKISKKTILKPAEFAIEKLYNQLAGTDWPSLDEILHYDKTKYSNNINKELADTFFKELQNNSRLYFKEPTTDYHPTPTEHLLAIQNYFEISPTTRQWVSDIDSKLLAGEPFEFHKTKIERL